MTITGLRALLDEHPDAAGHVHVLTADGYLAARAGIDDDGDLLVATDEELIVGPTATP